MSPDSISSSSISLLFIIALCRLSDVIVITYRIAIEISALYLSGHNTVRNKLYLLEYRFSEITHRERFKINKNKN